jgi:peptidoglycan/xylan/chitin deacetylase (PgdA/CDA1 family)
VSVKIPILLYHDLESLDCPSEKSDAATSDTVVDAENFESQIRYFAENGYTTISIREYFEFRRRKNPILPKQVIITFDDGHYSNYLLALPVLQKYGFRATFFIIADRVDHNEYHMTSVQLKEMTEQGMEIGSHGLTHKYLPLMEHAEIEHELRESRRLLESIIQQPVEYLAFPGGHYNRNILKLLISAGYKGACSCLQGLNTLNTNPYLLKRIEIRKRFSLDEFEHIFHPAHIAFYQLIDFWKGLIRRSIGLNAYTRLRSKLYKFYIFKR